ncbi:MAG: hypothetical protein E5Y06_00785 [Mesorhizobium sp.]|uniref:hypothetical protein n=1 Tax=Mesorhizobium sp. TaxID=1871066 RepID=UPI00121BDB0E|nr:hypothetical protein [Mesorhizobium sp.]TIN98511.1 MAG: hypothetical protein E5Y06_00785 [Mesorhizobium sp.]TJU99100.1 MAG: hypothetical protein E5Y08_09470 [Mesorhizobium sp.]
MTTMNTIFLAAILWVGGGGLFIQGALTNPDASPSVATNSRNMLDDLVRVRPAALVAAVLFLAVWPAVWIGAHLVRR